jgi:MOSC domain-containing protein YiiM
MLDVSGVAGDGHRNLLVHGGPEKAVLMIAAESIHGLIAEGFPLFYGALGENLTVEGIDPHAWRSGQRWRIGDEAAIELTELRMPCANLHVYGISLGAQLYDARCKAGDIASPRWAHGGFYARVIRGGLVAAGAPVVLESDARRVT